MVREVDETTHTVRTNDSIMALKQAVMGFRLVDDKGLAIPVDTLVISSASGKLLVKSHVGPASTPYPNGSRLRFPGTVRSINSVLSAARS